LTLTDDDSDETLQFRLYEPSSDGGGGGGADLAGVEPAPEPQGNNTTGLVLFAGVGLVLLVGVFWFVRRRARPKRGFGRTVSTFLASPVVLAGLGILAIVIALNYRLLGLPPSVKLIGGVAGIMVAIYYILRRLGAFQWRIYAVIGAIVGVLSTEALRPGLLEMALGSQAFEQLVPLLAFGALYLGYKAIQVWRASKTTEIIVDAGADARADGDPEGGD